MLEGLLSVRPEATLRSQVLQPPYIYRWAVLIAVTVILVAIVLQAFRSGPGVEDKAHVAPSAAPKPPAPVPARVIRQLPGGDRVVALTFDDGPHPQQTPQILDLLAEHHAVATFCMVGTQARAHPELVRRVVGAGMRLCNHTVHHDEKLARHSGPVIERELNEASDALRDAAGDDVPIRYFRAPGGNWTPALERIAAGHGMRPLAWSVDPRDWSRPGVDTIVTSVQQHVRPGSVILLHDGGGRRDQTVAALARLLPWLADQGYRLDFPA
jgi:peptidoglycan/xylan/chitin deacetylase (PgdA/CDA1 family)